MKKYLILIATIFVLNLAMIAQNKNLAPDFTIKSTVLFDTKPDFRKSNTTENTDVIVFNINLTNNGEKPIPDLGATQRGEHLNILINDSIQNPICLYNGVEIIGDHLLQEGQSDTYEWWIYSDDAYGEEFTVQWQYMDKYSEKYLISVKKRSAILIINK